MRIAAAVFGVIWIAAVVAGAILLIGMGRFRGGRGEMIMVFLAALPGVLMFRWGRRLGPVNLRAMARPVRPPSTDHRKRDR